MENLKHSQHLCTNQTDSIYNIWDLKSIDSKLLYCGRLLGVEIYAECILQISNSVLSL